MTNKPPPELPLADMGPMNSKAILDITGDNVWTGSKRQKQELRQKYGGKCAYCGCELTKMHADHMKPIRRSVNDPWGNRKPVKEQYNHNEENNVVSNMMPACPPCNLHKGGHSLESWREYIQRSAEIVRKQTSTFRAGERFGIIVVNSGPVVFYFEEENDDE